MRSVLLTNDLSFRHSGQFALQDLSLSVQKGEIISLLGPNGSGKSTLLKLMARLLEPHQGSVILDGKELASMKTADVARKLSMLPQMNDHQLDLTVRELVEFGRHPHKPWFQRLDHEDHLIVDWSLELTGLGTYEHRFLKSLSGGERQRAWIAMALAQKPQVLLLDEPTTYLDIAHQLEVMELIRQLNQEYGMTVIMVLHDINQASQYSDRLVVMKKGNIEYDGPPECVLCKAMFQHIFEIEVEIYEDGERPFFTPKRCCNRASQTI